jgi:putative transcriptional regulator
MNKSSALDFNPDRMIAELQQLVADKKKGDLKKYRITQIKAPPVRPKTAAEILGLRENKIKMSRVAFASVLNVPAATLRAWETGKRNPSGAAVRLLDIIDKQPSIALSFVVAHKSASGNLVLAAKRSRKAPRKTKRPLSRKVASKERT